MDIIDTEYSDLELFIASKKTELLELLKEYDTKLESNEDYYDIIIQNPNNGKTLTVCFDFGGFILFFGGWHGHYDYDEDDYDSMTETIFDILNGKMYALAVIEDNFITSSRLSEGDVSNYSDGIQLFKDEFGYISEITDLTNFSGTIEANFWNPIYSKSFDIVDKLES